jgi:hypothetical protein
VSPEPGSATTATTIQGASILSGIHRPRGDVFDVELSPDGIEIRRAGQPPAHMSWSEVSQWEIEERRGGVLLTLRGGGATTPLVVPGWAQDDLEALMRTTADASADAPASTPAGGGAATDAAGGAPEPVADVFAAALAPAAHEIETATPPGPAPNARRWRDRRPSAATLKSVVTVVLLGLLATAVTLVLLQSAGVISWGFLGPTA